jgi:hypothetical protein
MLFDDPRFFAIKAGNVSLKLHNHKDIFYGEDVNAFEAMPDYETLIGIEKVGFDDGSFGTEGTEVIFRNIEIDSKETIIEGFYTDTMPSDFLIPYEVRIYIRYEEEETEIKEIKKL